MRAERASRSKSLAWNSTWVLGNGFYAAKRDVARRDACAPGEKASFSSRPLKVISGQRNKFLFSSSNGDKIPDNNLLFVPSSVSFGAIGKLIFRQVLTRFLNFYGEL